MTWKHKELIEGALIIACGICAAIPSIWRIVPVLAISTALTIFSYWDGRNEK